jgi:hypothetical protein
MRTYNGFILTIDINPAQYKHIIFYAENYYYYYYYYYYLTAIGLAPGGSSTHLHTNSTQNIKQYTELTSFKGLEGYLDGNLQHPSARR